MISHLFWWHTETSYIIQWKGLSAEQATYRGVRQGCRGAPFFWASFIALILQMVATDTSEDWMRKHCTFYADDGHARFVFSSFEELQQGLVFFGKLISVLERMGMTVNMKKSAVILRWGGKQQSHAKKRFVQKQLDRSVLLIPKAEGGSHAIPITEKHEYLGVQMGYHNFQSDTMKARLQACKVRFKQMQRWFTKNGTLGSEGGSVADMHFSNRNLWTGCNRCGSHFHSHVLQDHDDNVKTSSWRSIIFDPHHTHWLFVRQPPTAPGALASGADGLTIEEA